MNEHNQVEIEASDVAAGAPEWGKQLRKLREERNLSALDIANELYLDVSLIDALENEETDKLPESSFIKGYLRNYARTLDVPCDDIIKAFEVVCSAADDSPCIQRISKVKETTSQDRGPRYATWGLVAGGFILLGAWWWAEILPNSTERKPDNVVAETFKSSLQDEEKNELQADIQVDGESVAVSSLMVSEVVPPKPVEVAEPMPQESVEAVVVEPADNGEKLQTLHLVFTQDSWVEIKDSTGKRLLYDMGREGTSRDLAGVAPFKILLGNASSVLLDFNDERIDHTPFQRNGIARFTLGE